MSIEDEGGLRAQGTAGDFKALRFGRDHLQEPMDLPATCDERDQGLVVSVLFVDNGPRLRDPGGVCTLDGVDLRLSCRQTGINERALKISDELALVVDPYGDTIALRLGSVYACGTTLRPEESLGTEVRVSVRLLADELVKFYLRLVELREQLVFLGLPRRHDGIPIRQQLGQVAGLLRVHRLRPRPALQDLDDGHSTSR
jgi:hypothetical protein